MEEKRIRQQKNFLENMWLDRIKYGEDIIFQPNYRVGDLVSSNYLCKEKFIQKRIIKANNALSTKSGEDEYKIEGLSKVYFNYLIYKKGEKRWWN